MSQWKVGGDGGEYIPAHGLGGTTLVTKHNNVPHTPTPTLSLYELSGQDHPYVPTSSTPWTKRFSTMTHPETSTRSDGTMSYQQVSDDKQQWPRQEKVFNKRPMDFTTQNTDKNTNHNISCTSSSAFPTSSLLHPLANDYMDLDSNGSPVRTTSSQVIPPVTLPNNQHQDHRIGNHGMVALIDTKHMKQHQYQQQHQHQMEQSQLTSHSGHSLYSENRDTIHRPTRYPYSRSYSDTPPPHSSLSYHQHHSSQHRHNSIATAEHAVVHAAVAAAYQSGSMHPGQMTWYGQNSTFQKGSSNTNNTTATSTTPPLYNHSTSSSPRLISSTTKRHNEAVVYHGSNYTPMSDLMVSSRIDNVEYEMSSSATTSGAFLGQHRPSNQWVSSSSSTSSSSPTPQSPPTSDMHSLLSMSFTPNESYNKKSSDGVIMDQQQNNETNIGNSSLAPQNETLSLKDQSSDSTSKKQNKSQQQKPGKRRSPNAFFVFCSDRRQLLKQGKPNARNTDINRQLGDVWKALTQAERDWYKQKADKIRAALPNDNSPTPKSMISGLFTQRPNDSPFTYAPTTTTSGDTLRSSSSSFDPTFNELAHASSPNRNTSLALTIAADDESVASYQQNSRKRGSLENSDLASTLSSPSQHPLAVASLSGAAEADALDQATLVGIHPCEGNKGNGEKVERLKRPPNAYLLYNREMRPKLLDQNDNLNPALISKLISQSWRDLPQEIKDGYRNEATRLKKQHMEDHPDYKYIRRSRTQLEQAGYKSRPSKKQIKTHDDEHSDKAVKKAKVAKQTSASSLATKDTKQQQRRFPDPRGRKKKKHKNPFGPKHPMSGFLYFASDVRPEIVQKHPSSNVGAISKLLAERWKKMTDQDKLPWEEKAREDKARYAREVMEFKLAQDQNELHKQQAENNDTWQQQQRKWMEQNRDGFQYNSNNTNDHSLSSMGTHKSSISSMSSLATSSTTSTATSASARMIKALDHNKLIDTVDYRHHYQHRDDGISTNRHYNKHQQHQKQFYRPVSRIHSALTSSRPASPTELDSDTIQTVAQMVNPRNITPTSSLAHLGRELHPLSASASLASIIHHHHHESSIGTYQLHVPATPPSPAIDTI